MLCRLMSTVPPQMLLVNSVIMKCHGCVDSNIWSFWVHTDVFTVLRAFLCTVLFSTLTAPVSCLYVYGRWAAFALFWSESLADDISPCVALHSIPAAYIQFPGLWDCETRSSPRPFPPWRFLHGLQHRAWLFRWWLKLRWAVTNLFFFVCFCLFQSTTTSL